MRSINCRGKLLSLETPVVMGIINVNDNSFYAGNRKSSIKEAVALAEKMLLEGASILDIGGQSTAPDSTLFTAEEELKRVMPAVEAILKKFPEAVLSIDTFYATVAETMIKAGVSMVNDITAGNFDKQMLSTVGRLGVPYIAMHMKGTPQTMQGLSQYKNITREVMDYFIEKTGRCLQAGINDIILDPGYGFAKTKEQNFELLNNSQVFKILEKPILTGISRKSMIYKTLKCTVEDSLNGTTVLNTIALQKGTDILRVHDVKEAVETITLANKLKNCSN